MDLETFLQKAHEHRRCEKAQVGLTPIGELYRQLETGTSSLKFSVVGERVFVAVDGLARALRSY